MLNLPSCVSRQVVELFISINELTLKTAFPALDFSYLLFAISFPLFVNME